MCVGQLRGSPTAEELALLWLIKREQAIPPESRALTLALRDKGWIEAIYLEPTGYELTAVGRRVLVNEAKR